MEKYICDPCGYVYDPEVGDPDNGIAPGTAFEDLPEDWVCPICGVGKEDFSKYEEWFELQKKDNEHHCDANCPFFINKKKLHRKA